jgi:hypothetical protein
VATRKSCAILECSWPSGSADKVHVGAHPTTQREPRSGRTLASFACLGQGPAKVALVIHYQNRPGRFGMGGNPTVIPADHFGSRSQVSPNFTVDYPGFFWQRDNGRLTHGPRQRLPGSRTLPVSFRSIDQLAMRYYGQNCFTRFPPRETAENRAGVRLCYNRQFTILQERIRPCPPRLPKCTPAK